MKVEQQWKRAKRNLEFKMLKDNDEIDVVNKIIRLIDPKK
jgi:hypothetical protein